MHYQQILDKIFGKGSLCKHRTLFGLFSSDYNHTTMEKKLEILTTIRVNGMDLHELLDDYKEFYTEENKIHVVDVADEGLEILLRNETNE